LSKNTIFDFLQLRLINNKTDRPELTNIIKILTKFSDKLDTGANTNDRPKIQKPTFKRSARDGKKSMGGNIFFVLNLR